MKSCGIIVLFYATFFCFLPQKCFTLETEDIVLLSESQEEEGEQQNIKVLNDSSLLYSLNDVYPDAERPSRAAQGKKNYDRYRYHNSNKKISASTGAGTTQVVERFRNSSYHQKYKNYKQHGYKNFVTPKSHVSLTNANRRPTYKPYIKPSHRPIVPGKAIIDDNDKRKQSVGSGINFSQERLHLIPDRHLYPNRGNVPLSRNNVNNRPSRPNQVGRTDNNSNNNWGRNSNYFGNKFPQNRRPPLININNNYGNRHTATGSANTPSTQGTLHIGYRYTEEYKKWRGLLYGKCK